MLIYSMSVSVDGSIADREARSGGRPLTRSSFASTSRQTRELGAHERSVMRLAALGASGLRAVVAPLRDREQRTGSAAKSRSAALQALRS
jgi:hypothetical protein